MARDSQIRADDEELLRRFLTGDAAASQQVERWSRQILLYRRLGLSREDIDDIVQDVLTAVWQAAARPQFRLQVGLHAFVRKVTLARAIDRVRRLRVRRSQPLAEHLDPKATIASWLEWDEASTALFAALERMEVRCRELIHLHYFEDWPYARIAALEGRSESTLRVRMFHCLRGLRGHLRDAGIGEP
jgi:RNA polymerase sigma factor (sigma-70 family)